MVSEVSLTLVLPVGLDGPERDLDLTLSVLLIPEGSSASNENILLEVGLSLLTIESFRPGAGGQGAVEGRGSRPLSA